MMNLYEKSLYHIAIIPDGNRRWAKIRGFPSILGHQEGVKRAKELINTAKELNLKILTLWGFSTENWNRSPEEVRYIMDIFYQLVEENLQTAVKDKVRIVHLGRKDRLERKLMKKLIEAESKTKKYSKYYLCLGIDYGGRDEILRAIKSILDNEKAQQKNFLENFPQFLDTKVLPYPDPDLIIRTGGEKRTSGFLPWQGVYSEWIFYPKYFPDFKKSDFLLCIEDYFTRQRRYGR